MRGSAEGSGAKAWGEKEEEEAEEIGGVAL